MHFHLRECICQSYKNLWFVCVHQYETNNIVVFRLIVEWHGWDNDCCHCLFWFLWVLFVSHCFLTNSFGLCNIVEQNNSQTISNSKMTIFKGSIWQYCIKSFHSNYMHYPDLPAMFTMMRFYPELTMFYQIPCSLTLHRRSFNSLTSRVRNAFNVWRSSFLPFIYRLFISCKKWSNTYRYIYTLLNYVLTLVLFLCLLTISSSRE